VTRHRDSATLIERLGREGNDDLLELLEASRREWTEHVLSIATERFERRLAEEIAAFRVDIMRELHESLAAIRQEFTRELASVRVELIRWSFVFWVGQVAVTVGALALVLRTLAR
jgi:hypothetical protein